MGSQDGEDSQQGSSWRTEQSHIHVQINWEAQLRGERPHNPGFQHGGIQPQNL